MVSFAKTSHAELEEMARRQYEQQVRRKAPKRSRARNVGQTLVMLDAERMQFTYRGRSYDLLPVSFEDGLRFLEARQVVEETEDADPTPEVRQRYRQALQTTVRLAPRYVIPSRGALRRLLWRLRFRRNPFRKATEAEVGQLLGFFLGCRMRSSVRYPAT